MGDIRPPNRARLETAIAAQAMRLRRDERRYRTTLEAYQQLVEKRARMEPGGDRETQEVKKT